MPDPTVPMPEFEKPPVTEVVCGVTFEPLVDLLVPHFGLLWQALGEEYGEVAEAAPLATVFERLDERGTETNVEFGDRPPLPRVWFVGSSGDTLLQVQRDRFMYNWRKPEESAIYPRYETVYPNFEERWQEFTDFLRQNRLGIPSPAQYELTYFNHIPAGQGWSSLDDVGNVLPDIGWRQGSERFLGSMEGLAWRTSFQLPDRYGRLHVHVRPGVRQPDGVQVLSLELTARGMPATSHNQDMRLWFDVAHEWIVRGFADLTGTEVQREHWGRTA